MEFDLSSLNQEQLAPVLDTEGAVLVTAGAGSGKTRLLTHRIAYLISKGVSPYDILAITFTNKAANEMAERLIKMTQDAEYVWVSTFHSMCARILRRYAPFLGYTKSFSIYADAEREKLVSASAAEVCEDDDSLKKQAVYHISNAKNLGLSPENYRLDFAYVADIDRITEVYSRYESKLKANNAMDFDDLLLKTKVLLTECKEAFDYYSDRFRYIHVDEFQDTNTIQYELVKLLAAKHRNVLAVGDEDQCIYGWRGANILNINSFISDFGCKVYKLEQNYRSTKNILEVANRLIANNTSRIEKRLWTNNEIGDSVRLFVGNGDGDEADFVSQTICALRRKYALSDMAILMRINALTRPFEQRFMQYGIAHKVYGGFKFYDRKEIKDLLAYFRIIANHSDNEAIARVINFPKRGIGASAFSALATAAACEGKSLYDEIIDVENSSLSNAVKNKVASFSAILKELDEQKDKIPLDDLMRNLVSMLDLKTLYGEDTEENADRKANIGELINSVREYINNNPDASLDDYMQTVTLWSDLDDAPTADCVNIATVHSAKGLEFKVVFVVGMEDGIFPISRAESKAELEEERRLFYVAVTRAKEKLFITRARSRYMYGQVKDSIPSRFLFEAGLEHKAERRFDEPSGYRRDVFYGKTDDETQKTVVPQYVASSNVPKMRNDGKGFNVGDRVRHKKFGLGTIISMSGTGISLSAIIDFEGYGKMNIAVAYAPITREEQ